MSSNVLVSERHPIASDRPASHLWSKVAVAVVLLALLATGIRAAVRASPPEATDDVAQLGD